MAKTYPRLSQVLKKLLFQRDMKPVDLARALDIPAPTIHRLVTGKSTRPYESSLKPIADFFAIDIKQLLGEEPLAGWESLEQPSALSPRGAIKMIPVIGWEDVNKLEEARKTSKKEVAVSGNVHEDSFVLVMNDHSMEPLFPRKTLLIFDPYKKPMDRSYVLVKLDGKEIPTFRQLLIDVDYKYLKPLNPDLSMYKMRLLNDKDQVIACLLESRVNHEPEADAYDVIEGEKDGLK